MSVIRKSSTATKHCVVRKKRGALVEFKTHLLLCVKISIPVKAE